MQVISNQPPNSERLFRSASRWVLCTYVVALGCAQPSASEVSTSHRSAELGESTPESTRVAALVQTGRIQEFDHPEPVPEYLYSEARYDQAGQLMEHVTYRRDGTRAQIRQHEDGRLQSATRLEDDGSTVDFVERFVHDGSNRLIEIRYCATAALDCPAWRVDHVETWTPQGLPLTGTIAHNDEAIQIAWKYDAEGHLIEKTWAMNIWSFDYDGQGRLIGWNPSYLGADEGERRVLEYDDAGRIVRETRHGAFLPVHAVIEYSYEYLLELQPGVTITGVEDVAQSHGSVK